MPIYLNGADGASNPNNDFPLSLSLNLFWSLLPLWVSHVISFFLCLKWLLRQLIEIIRFQYNIASSPLDVAINRTRFCRSVVFSKSSLNAFGNFCGCSAIVCAVTTEVMIYMTTLPESSLPIGSTELKYYLIIPTVLMEFFAGLFFVICVLDKIKH